MNNRLDYAESLGYDKGYGEGYDKGYEGGKINEKIEIAKNMLGEDLPIDVIMRVTNLSKEQIEKLK